MDTFLKSDKTTIEKEENVLTEHQGRLGVTREILVSMKVACAKSVEWARRGMVQKTLHFSLHGFNKETEYSRVSEKFTVLAGKFYGTLHVGDVLLTTERLWVLILITARHYGGFNNLLKTRTAKFLTLAAQQALPLLQATSDAQHAAAAPAVEAQAPPALEEGEIAGGGKLTEDQVYQKMTQVWGELVGKLPNGGPRPPRKQRKD